MNFLTDLMTIRVGEHMNYEGVMMSILLDTGKKENVLEYYEQKYNDILSWKLENMKGVKCSEITLDNFRAKCILELNDAFQKVYKIHI